jgi:hypothetical protein
MFDYANTLLEKGGYSNLTASERSSVDEEAMLELRRIRDGLLKETDKYTIVDFPLSAEEHTAIIQYRQELRDMPTTQSPMFEDDGGSTLQNVTFPTNQFVTDDIYYRYASFKTA